MKEFAFEQAFRMKAEKTWKHVKEGSIFAVELSNGEIRYCLYMSHPETGAITFSILAENKGFQAVNRFYSRINMGYTFEDYIEYVHNQDNYVISFTSKSRLMTSESVFLTDYMKSHGISSRGKNAYPRIIQTRPQHIPWPVRKDEDFRIVGECLSAAMVVDKLLTCKEYDKESIPTLFDITDGAEDEIPVIKSGSDFFELKNRLVPKMAARKFPSPKWNDLEIARMKHGKRTGGVWLSELFSLPEDIVDEDAEFNEYDEPVEAPFVPYFMGFIEESNGMLLGMKESESSKKPFDSLKLMMIEQIQKNGRPRKIVVRNGATEAFLKGICHKLGIQLERVEEHEVLGYYRKDVQIHCMRHKGFDDDYIAEFIGEPLEDEMDDDIPDDEYIEGENGFSQTDDILDTLSAEEANLVIQHCVEAGILQDLPEEHFQKLVKAILMHDIQPKLEKKVKAEYRRRQKEKGE